VKKPRQRYFNYLLLLLGLFYLLTHLFKLTALPVFADEAIYIRWAQLIMDDWRQYLFFPLNDGKTPLLIWFFIPFQYLFADPLLAARLISVLAGLVQIYVLGQLAKLWGGGKKAQIIAVALSGLLPFWFFHQRMALMDQLMTLGLSLSLFFAAKLLLGKTKSKNKLNFLALIFSLGASLWTKLSALLFAPVLVVFAWFFVPNKIKTRFSNSIMVGLAVLGGVGVFLLLKLNPAFSQLFSRGGDFLFKTQELLSGDWRFSLSQLPRYFQELSSYLTPVVLATPFLGLFFKQNRRQHFLNLLLSAVFLLPIFIMGKVVYARYFLPVAIFFTLSASLFFGQLLTFVENQTKFWRKAIFGLVAALLIGGVLSPVGFWLYTSWFDINLIPFPKNDQEQYLLEWSAGQGVKEVSELLLKSSQNQRVVLATEGYFGTLPDGILLYLHNRRVDNLAVTGIGQPVHQLPPDFIKQAQLADQAWLLVNSHRLKMQLAPELLIEKYCRPQNAPCLELWDVTDLAKKASI